MTKLCSVCRTDNRDEAQFCRACGTAFAAAPAARAEAADGYAANVCAECGFRNKPGIRYCANCGMSLAAPEAQASVAAAPLEGSEAAAGVDPPSLSYPSLETVAPYAPPRDTDHSALFDARTTPDIPDPDAAVALRPKEALQTHGDTTATFADAPAAPNRTRLVVGVVVALLVLAGIAAWVFIGRSNPSPPLPAAASPPVLAAPAPAVAPAPEPIIIEPAPASSPPALASGASAAGSALAVPPAAAVAAPVEAPLTAATPPRSGEPVLETADAEAKRVTDAKRREKAARDKANREAKAKALAEQREQSAAAQRAEQEARRRAEEAQRARANVAPAPSTPAPVVQARGVREICSGRGTIAEAICQSRQCGSPEHANEAICRQLRDADERRRNIQN